MKKTILTIVLCISISTLTFAQKSDHDLVKQAVTYYLDGGTNNDYETLKKAFHKDATMKYISKDGYKEVNALELFKKAIKPGPKQDRETRVISVDIAGKAAQVKLRIDYSKLYIIDYMNLLKIDGEWKIVNKIFFREPKK